MDFGRNFRFEPVDSGGIAFRFGAVKAEIPGQKTGVDRQSEFCE